MTNYSFLYIFPAIKTGRCSNERKTRDIEEVKKLEIQARIKEDGSLVTQEERNERLEHVITRLTEIHHEHIPHSASVIAELRVLEDKFVVSYPGVTWYGVKIHGVKQLNA